MIPSATKITNIHDTLTDMLCGEYTRICYDDARDPRVQKRVLIDATCFLAMSLRILPANSPMLMRAQSALDENLLKILDRGTFIASPRFSDRMRDIIAYETPWSFNEIGEMVTHISRLSDKVPLDEIVLVGLLFNAFNSSRIDLTPIQTYQRILTRSKDVLHRAAMQPIGLQAYRDMELDATNLRMREWIHQEFTELDRDIVSNSTDDWAFIAIQKVNLIFSVVCLAYLRRGAIIECIHGVSKGIHIEMLCGQEGVI